MNKVVIKILQGSAVAQTMLYVSIYYPPVGNFIGVGTIFWLGSKNW